MSRATVTTFGRGVSFVASGETGTQANEFEAAIKSVTSSTTVGAVFVYDTRNDSDSGAWRKKARGSWYYEDLNTTTRGGRREFPSIALIVADNVSATSTLSIYDLDDVSAPLWMQFTQGGSFPDQYILGRSTPNITSVTALNGRVYVGMDNSGYGEALVEIDFANDGAKMFSTTSWKQNNSIAERNTSVTNTQAVGGDIVNNAVNDVAAKYLEGGELDSLGLVRPVVACATDGGVSVIHPNGSVYDQTKTISSTVNSYDVAWGDNGDLFWSSRAISSKGTYVLWLRNTLYADSSATPDALYYPTGIVGGNDVQYLGSSSPYCNDFKTIKDGLAVGSSHGLSIIKQNNANPNDGAVAYITSEYNTGYMVGDIRFAGLANHWHNDRSVKGNNLTENGSISNAVVATDAELRYYYGFSSSNYLSRANDTDFDFGTGDFSIMFWCKSSTTGSTNDFIARGDVTPEAGDFFIRKNASEKIQLFRHTGTSYQSPISASSSSIGTSWSQVVVTRSGTTVSIYVNGKREVSGTWSDTFTPSGGSAFTIGLRLSDTSVTGQHMSLSLVRLSATAPTPTQVADIYRQEAPLFRSGAKCLLQHSAVHALDYDKSTDLLSVGQTAASGNEGVTKFRGLENVAQFTGSDHASWSGDSIKKISTAGGVSAFGRTDSTGGVLVDLPAIDVRGDINTADSKLPDDGKFHFSGVTTNATPTVIGQIPISGGENYIVKANVIGCRYQSADSAHRIIVDLKGGFSRTMSGNVIAEPLMSKLSELEWSSSTLDVEYDVDTSANTIRIKVTGHSAVTAEWNATVEVQRITERSYER